MFGNTSSSGTKRARIRAVSIDWPNRSWAAPSSRCACVCSAPNPLTTRTPATLSSTTSASAADSRCTPSAAGCSRVEKRLANTLSIGRLPTARIVSRQSMRSIKTVAPIVVSRFAQVSGIITTKLTICCRSVLARLIS